MYTIIMYKRLETTISLIFTSAVNQFKLFVFYLIRIMLNWFFRPINYYPENRLSSIQVCVQIVELWYCVAFDFVKWRKGVKCPTRRVSGTESVRYGTVLSFYRAFLRCFLSPVMNSLNSLRDNDSSDVTTNGIDDEAWGRKEMEKEESKGLWLHSPYTHTHTRRNVFSTHVCFNTPVIVVQLLWTHKIIIKCVIYSTRRRSACQPGLLSLGTKNNYNNRARRRDTHADRRNNIIIAWFN